ncbi:hypothetical protein OG548_23980 [Streptomyces sp. NBC_01356]|uniref:hypothetical protein n=1 Tax=Streptomyces sp. NBC_01356 TaxID=2903836 RepID=UPI002E36FD3D|nr:hypothetical protein [Streptomyces sp. NBC_01356]
MVFFELVGMAVQFTVAHLVDQKLGPPGAVLLALVVVGIRARHPQLTWWAAFLFILLMAQA